MKSLQPIKLNIQNIESTNQVECIESLQPIKLNILNHYNQTEYIKSVYIDIWKHWINQ